MRIVMKTQGQNLGVFGVVEAGTFGAREVRAGLVSECHTAQ
jgi:hypothetical protein